MTAKIRKYVIPYLPYAFIGILIGNLGEAYRLSAGANIGQRLIGMMGHIGPAFEGILPGPYLFDWLVGLAGAGLIRLFVWQKSKNAKKFRKDVEYGSARWGTEKDIKPFIDPKFQNNVILTGTEFLTMNTRPANPANARNLNACIIGSSGSGKTRFWLTPQLLQAHSSYVCVDPKGSILGQVGFFLQKQGYKIKVFNSVDFSKSMHYNPLAYLKTENDILKFVNALIENTKGDGKEGDPFWTKSETLLYCALIGYIVFEGPEEERNMITLVDMINSMETREDDENFKNAVDYMFMGLEKRKPGSFAVRQYKKFRLASGKTAKSILISCAARLAPFDIQAVRDLLSVDELELDTLGDEKTALFVIISDTNPAFNFIPAMMYSMMFNTLCDKAGASEGGRLKVHVRCILDEFANVGKIPNFEQLIATIRSREISACVILQSQSQLKGLYKDHADTIAGNMDTTLFLGGKEKGTLKEISELLGKETVDLYNTSVTKGQSESHGKNFSKVGKDLMSVDELAVMDGGKCICMVRGERPFLSNKYDLLKHPNYKYLSDADKRNAFNIEKYLSTRLRTRPEDVFEVYEIDVDEAEEQQA